MTGKNETLRVVVRKIFDSGKRETATDERTAADGERGEMPNGFEKTTDG